MHAASLRGAKTSGRQSLTSALKSNSVRPKAVLGGSSSSVHGKDGVGRAHSCALPARKAPASPEVRLKAEARANVSVSGKKRITYRMASLKGCDGECVYSPPTDCRSGCPPEQRWTCFANRRAQCPACGRSGAWISFYSGPQRRQEVAACAAVPGSWLAAVQVAHVDCVVLKQTFISCSSTFLAALSSRTHNGERDFRSVSPLPSRELTVRRDHGANLGCNALFDLTAVTTAKAALITAIHQTHAQIVSGISRRQSTDKV